MALNDLELHVEVDGQGPPLVLLHGFTGSSRSWDDLVPVFARRATVIRVDALGHGQSPAPDDPRRYSLDWAARDLLAVLEKLGLTSVDLLGYSMGGRMALHFAVSHPQRVAALILESASAGLERESERQQRIAADEALAERIERDGLAAFVAEWERLPLLALAPHVGEDVRRRQHEQRLNNSPRGLANSQRGMGTGWQAPLWDRLPAMRRPTTLIVGQADARYRALGERMQALLPDADLQVIDAAGHTVHLDQPAAFSSAVEAALDEKLTHPAGRC